MSSWSKSPSTPFGSVPERVPLDPDPLVSVAAQVRFTPVFSVRDQGFVAAFQEAIRRDYPLTEKRTPQQVAPGAGGLVEVADSVLWIFSDSEGNWQVVLSENFVTLRCSSYSDREDFLSRLRAVLDAVGAHVQPVLANRVGVQYTDRLSGEERLTRLPEFIRPELLGLGNAELGKGEVLAELTQAELSVDEMRLRGRWGHLPPKRTLDASIEALDFPSWVLDLDAFTESKRPFDPSECAEEVERYTDVVYGFFRWAVSEEFLASHGAAP